MAIELGAWRRLQISKEPPGPRSEMPLEDAPLAVFRCREASSREPRHDLAQNRNVILGLAVLLGPHDADLSEVAAQPCQRPLVQKAGEIVGAVRQQLAAAESDKEVEIFPLKTFRICRLRRLSQRGMSTSKLC